MRLIIEGPDGKGLFPSKRLKLSVGIAASSKSEVGMWVDFYVRLIEDAEAKLQKAFELRNFDEFAKLRREIDNYRAMLERVK